MGFPKMEAITFRGARTFMNHTNLLRRAVENRRRQLIRLLKANRVTRDPGVLNHWTLSELEYEWKRYLRDRKKDIGRLG